MNNYVTKLSRHCYFGNITNILNYYGLVISEAELVLISDILGCSCLYEDSNLFFGIPNKYCDDGLKKIGCETKVFVDSKSIYNALEQTPILLCINTSWLDHNIIFKGTNKQHYIVLIQRDNNRFIISDSFIQTFPQSVYQGPVDSKKVCQAIESGLTTGTVIIPYEQPSNYKFLLKDILIKYIMNNIQCNTNSVFYSLNRYLKSAIDNKKELLSNELLSKTTYDLKYAGAIARLDYILELFNDLFSCGQYVSESIKELKTKWELIANKLMKCSMTLNEKYYMGIFQADLPSLIEQELILYNRVAELEGLR